MAGVFLVEMLVLRKCEVAFSHEDDEYPHY